MALALSAIIIGAIVVPVTSLIVTRRQNAVTAADEIIVRITGRTADSLAGELTEATRSIEVITLLLDEAIEHDTVGRLLASHVESVPRLSGAFVGMPDGQFSFVRRDSDGLTLKQIEVTPTRVVSEASLDADLVGAQPVVFDDSYDPRTRPWYSSAEQAEGLIWTEPYVFFSSGQPGVTAALAVRDPSGAVAAIVGVDVSLDELGYVLDGLPIDSSAEAFILAGDAVVAASSGYTVAQPDGDGVTLATHADLGLDTDALIRARAESVPVPASEGSRLHVVLLDQPDLPSWDVVIQTGHIDFVDAMIHQSRVAIGATIVAALAMLAMVPLLVTRMRRPLDELSHRARTDHLTGLANRPTLLEEGAREIKRARHWDQAITVAVFDIDNFKSVNDQHGHTAGDETIRRIGATLRATVRPQDLVGRLGGDEFVLVVRDLSEADTHALLERVQAQLVESWQQDDRTEALGVTIGVTHLAGRDVSLEDLIEEADDRLISAKQSAKGSILTE